MIEIISRPASAPGGAATGGAPATVSGARAAPARSTGARSRRSSSARKATAPGCEWSSALREAHGTPGLQRVFREYVRGYGLPADFDLLTLLLDLGDEQDIVTVLGGIEELRESISPEEKSLLRKRLRNLEMATEFDGVADATVDLLERL